MHVGGQVTGVYVGCGACLGEREGWSRTAHGHRVQARKPLFLELYIRWNYKYTYSNAHIEYTLTSPLFASMTAPSSCDRLGVYVGYGACLGDRAGG